MKKLFLLGIAIVILFSAPITFADDDDDNQAFRAGYREGFRHGRIDLEAGLNFDYRHDHRFRSGISHDSSENESFRDGYRDGYQDAYYMSRDGDVLAPSVSSGNRPAGYGYRGYVMAFKDDDFDGDSRRFDVGRYRDLSDEWDEEIESIQLSGGVRVILFDEENFEGQSLIIETNSRDLDELNFKGRAESMIIEDLH